MSNVYTVTVNGKEISYGAYTIFSGHTEEEWLALCHEMVKVNYPNFYEKWKENEQAIRGWGNFIDVSERYEALLEELPQSSYSKAGTHPVWVVEAVDDRTLDKEITQSDVLGMLDISNLDELKSELEDYFDLSDCRTEVNKFKG